MTTVRPRIQSLIFEVTQDCNHACLHCYNVWQPAGRSSYPRGQLDPSRAIDLLAKALDETVCSHVTLTGGEPLLRPDLPQILEFLQKRGVRVTVISNGRLLNERTATSLIHCGAGLFELPLLSHRGEVHDELSGAPGAWEAVLSAMANIRLQHGQVVAAFVATRKNIEHLRETIRLAFAFGARGIMLNRFNPGGRGREHLGELLPTVEQVRTALAVAEAATVEFCLPISCSIPIQPCLIDISRFPHLGFGFCAAGSERAYYALDPLGNLRPCNHSDTILGNLFEESFADLITPERMSAFTCAIPGFCMGCDRRLECQGGCKASAQVCYGSLLAEEPFLQQNQLGTPKINPISATCIATRTGG
jgi:radical SAM protein with 4Fe4S-binding SPASM domain